MDILKITDPAFLKDLDINELNALASDIRNFLYASIAKTGGHLSSNLGVVELTIAMHKVFNSPQDKFIFDVGHQSYTHKILTGRASEFKTLRQFEGLSGFQKRSESVHDVWEAGHSSTSISAAIGMAVARDLNDEHFHILPIIGDGSITNGMSMEALNHLGHLNKKVIIVFNDNDMSISKNVGGANRSFSKLRVSKPYKALKHDLSSSLSKNDMGTKVLGSLTSVKNTIKKGVVDQTLFSNLGLDYLGPIDGHNIKDLIAAFEYAKTKDNPIVLHILTQKGKGIKACENDDFGQWHGVGQYDPKTGIVLSSNDNSHFNRAEIISKTLIRLAKEDENIVAISPAMISGSKLLEFQREFPDRTFDTGIAEEHATTFAAGLAISGKKPFLSLYSTFLQRSYDQINHDIARMNLPVVIGVDRAGIVGEDGETHQGVFDISLLSHIPNMSIVQAKDFIEAQHLLYSCFQYNRPIAIRYPRGSSYYEEVEKFELIEFGTWTTFNLDENTKAILIVYGNMVDKFLDRIESNSFDIAVINARFIKPLDETLLDHIATLKVPIYTYENEMLKGGLSSIILDYYNDNNQTVHLNRFGIDEEYVEQGSIVSIRKHYNLSVNYVLNTIQDELERK